MTMFDIWVAEVEIEEPENPDIILINDETHSPQEICRKLINTRVKICIQKKF